MANTYTQSHVHIVFAVRNRQALILPSFQEELHRYLTGITTNQKHRLIAVNSMPDHIHMLIGIGMHQAPADLMRIVKGDSSEWINKRRFCPHTFQWQAGYGWFHVDKSRMHGLFNL
jgi:putative transposase